MDKRKTQIDFASLKTGRRANFKKDIGNRTNVALPTLDTIRETRKRLRSPGHDAALTAGPKQLRLPQAIETGVRAYEYIPRHKKSPWSSCKKIHRVRFGDDLVIVAERIEQSCDLVTIKQLHGSNIENELSMIQQIHHLSINRVYEIFQSDEGSYLALEHMPRCLLQVANSPYLNEIHLVAIIRQVHSSNIVVTITSITNY
jgi:hypothetical protein